jgi:hypothetical protein
VRVGTGTAQRLRADRGSALDVRPHDEASFLTSE